LALACAGQKGTILHAGARAFSGCVAVVERCSSTLRSRRFQRQDRYASFVSMQRFSGTLGGRQGTFALHGQEIVANGTIN
jgi:hypothetical protein